MRAAAASSGAAQAFQQMIQHHIQQHPLQGTALSPTSVHYVAGRILVCTSSKQAMSKMSGQEMAKFGACLFVLLVDEVLVNEQRRILGLDLVTVHALLSECTLRSEPNAFLGMVGVVDGEGSAVSMAKEPDCFDRLRALALEAHDHESDDQTAARVRSFLTPDTARIPDAEAIAGLPLIARSILLTKLAPTLNRRAQCVLTLISLTLAGFGVAWPFLVGPLGAPHIASGIVPKPLGVFPGWQDGAAAGGITYAPSNLTAAEGAEGAESAEGLSGGGSQVRLVGFGLYQLLFGQLVLLVLAVCFPDNEFQSPTARFFNRVFGTICIASEAYAIVIHAAHYAATRSCALHPSQATSLECVQLAIHVAIFVWIGATCVAAAAVLMRSGGSWRLLRTMQLAEGSFLLCAVALLALTGEDRFPPADVPLAASMTRVLAPLLSAAIFTPSVRRSLAALGNRVGVNHVTLSLSHVTQSELRWLVGGVPLRTDDGATTITSSGSVGEDEKRE